MALPNFCRHVIYSGQNEERTSCVVGDITGDGSPEIIIASRDPKRIYWLQRTPTGPWQEHLLDDSFLRCEAGGLLCDVTRNGRSDLIMGCDYAGDELYWWENPQDPTKPWKRHLICRMPNRQTHDQFVADIDGDGRNELYFWNQQASALFCVRLPDDPYVSPWPGIHAVVGGLREEGICAADVDGDGRLELIAGLSWYRPLGKNLWQRHEFARGYVSPKSVAADFDGDGRPEIVISEGDASLNGRQYGRVVHFKAPSDITDLWQPTLLHDKLLEPHSLQVADFDGDGRPDLFVGEMGLPNGINPHPPAQRIFQNQAGKLVENIIDRGVGTHEAKVITIDGKTGIAGKPFRLKKTTDRNPEADCVHLWLPE